MKAVLLKAFGGVENFEDREWPEPEPKAGEVKIRAKVVGVNPTDYKARSGFSGGTLPILLGRDTAGVVESVGEGVSEFAPGDEVMSYLPRFGDSGGEGYAEFVCVPAEFVLHKPASFSFEQAAAVPLVSLTAYECVVMKARAVRGESAFVAGGSGGVGSMGVQMLRHVGADPIVVTAGSDRSAAYLTDTLGIRSENILRYSGLSLDEMAERAMEMNGGHLFRATFDFVGKDMKKLCLRLVDYFGNIASCAPEPGNPISEFFSSTEGPIYTKSCSFHGVFLRSPVRGGGRPYWNVYAEALRTIRDWFEAGHIRPPAVTNVGPLSAANIAAAHTRLEEGHTQGKLVLTVGT